MNKRLLKRHKRQVARAKDRVRLSEPDVRTPEERKAAQEASRSPSGRSNDAQATYNTPAVRSHAGPTSGSKAKADG
jgi:hypothetical protein